MVLMMIGVLIAGAGFITAWFNMGRATSGDKYKDTFNRHLTAIGIMAIGGVTSAIGLVMWLGNIFG